MKNAALLPLVAALALGPGLQSSAFAWARAGGFGGHSFGGGGEATHVNRFGGSTSANVAGGWSHTNVDGGHSAGVAGYGGVHTTAGGFSTYHPPTGYAGYGYHAPVAGYAGYAPYHAPVAVPYAAGGCYGCAAAAGAVVGLAAGAAIASAAHPVYPIGTAYAALPGGAVFVERNGLSYYQMGSTWLQPAYGANGVYYTVVAAP